VWQERAAGGAKITKTLKGREARQVPTAVIETGVDA
jgi:hypothetical protein